MNEKRIRHRLVQKGRALFHAPRQLIQFTGNPNADALLNDLATFPHAFVLACLMDRQIKAEKAWLIPLRISEKVGDFSMSTLASLTREDVTDLMTRPDPLHRFVDTMAGIFWSGVQRIRTDYADDASKIWANTPSSAEAIYRFLQFEGAGPKIASMAVNILAREFKIPFSDYYSVDISADVHVKRVFARLGISPSSVSEEQVRYKARALCPDFPGILDFPCWDIGRNFCKANGPDCSNCYLNDLCPTAAQHRRSS